MDQRRQRLLDGYVEFLRLSLASAEGEGPAYAAAVAMGERVLEVLPGADVDALAERLEKSGSLLVEAEGAAQEAPGKPGAEPARPESLRFSGEHPAWILYALCGDARKHFGLRDTDMPDVDDTLLRDYIAEAFPRRFNAGGMVAPMDLESIISILPTEYVMPNTQLSSELSASETEEGQLDVVVRKPRRPSEKPLLTKAILTFGDDRAVITPGRQKYNPYDSAVYSGVITLYEAENTVFTPAMVYRAMNGLTESEYVNPTTLAKVAKSIEKNRKSQLSLDFTEEAKAYMRGQELGPDFKTTYEGNLLVADKITVRNNGVEQTAYKLLRKPILYEYAQSVGQVISVPIRLLQTKGGVRSTEDVIVLREYLLRQIENYRRRHRSGSFTIPYASIYEVCGVSPETHKNLKDKYKKIRNHTEALLGEWKRLNYIADFESKRDGGRAISLVEIAI